MRHVMLISSLTLLSAAVQAEMTLNGSTTVTLAEPITTSQDVTSQKLTQMLDLRYFGDSWQLRANGRMRYDAIYDTDHPFSEQAESAYRFDSDWRELTLQYDQNGWHYSLGYQQIVWGKADNLRIIDQINPLDFRDFVLPDLSEYRRSLLMATASGYLGEWEAEFIYIPFFEPNRIAASGSQFEWDYLPADVSAQVIQRNPNYPSRSFDNGELGSRWSRFWGETDVTLTAFYTRDDNPVYRIVNWLDYQGIAVPEIQAEYARQWQFGAALSTPLPNSLIARMEINHIPNARYNDLSSSDGLAKSATTHVLLGLDYLYKNWLFALQANDRLIHDWHNDYLISEHQAVYTLSAEGDNLSGKLRSRVAYTYMPNNGDGNWLQLRSQYQLNSSWSSQFELNLLNGQRDGFLGQFRDIDLLQVGIQYAF